mmetsp:Transcript_11661/g.15215  ORF Transcript_11661/g.15215 Transcript_11661/m.15215 type:complete len:278 (+) Transcript_11661:61-894(+)
MTKQTDQKHIHQLGALGTKRKFRNRNDLNVSRKVQHAISGLIFACFYNYNHVIFYRLLTVLVIGTFLVEILRRVEEFDWINSVILTLCGNTLREHEMLKDENRSIMNMTGSFYFFTGTWITATCFCPLSVILGTIQLGIADPACSYVGYLTRDVKWSRYRGKGLLGILAGTLCCIPLNYQILTNSNWKEEVDVPSSTTVFYLSVLIGLSGSFADWMVPSPTLSLTRSFALGGISIPRIHLDDNLVIPVFTASVASITFSVFDWSVEEISDSKPYLFV